MRTSAVGVAGIITGGIEVDWMAIEVGESDGTSVATGAPHAMIAMDTIHAASSKERLRGNKSLDFMPQVSDQGEAKTGLEAASLLGQSSVSWSHAGLENIPKPKAQWKSSK
jgi:hypothetical protein